MVRQPSADNGMRVGCGLAARAEKNGSEPTLEVWKAGKERQRGGGDRSQDPEGERERRRKERERATGTGGKEGTEGERARKRESGGGREREEEPVVHPLCPVPCGIVTWGGCSADG